MKAVSIEIFNLNRLAIFLYHFLAGDYKILSSKRVNQKENVWFFTKDKYNRLYDRISIGVPISSHTKDANRLKKLIDIYSDSNKCDYILSHCRDKVIISLGKDCTHRALLESAIQAIVVNFLAKIRLVKQSLWTLEEKTIYNSISTMMKRDLTQLDCNDMEFLRITREFAIKLISTSDLHSLRSESELQSKSTDKSWLKENDQQWRAEYGWDLSKCLITGDEWRFLVNYELISQ